MRHAKNLPKPKGTKIESYLKKDYWQFETEEAELTITLFKEKFGSEKYEALKDKRLLPGEPDLFIERLKDLKNRFNNLLSEWREALKTIDVAILQAYGLKGVDPEELELPLIR